MYSVESFLYSPVCEISFAGFRATTLGLQNAGWELSARQGHSPNRAGYDIQLMMNHSGGGLTMLSSMQMIDYSFLRDKMMSNEMHFDVVGLQVGERSFFMPKVRPFEIDFSARSFNAIDATPSLERIDLNKIDLMKFGVFKKINDSANIFLPEKTISELMDDILSKQKPIQDEIRKNRKREEFVQDFNRNPNEEIKVQLIAV